MLPVLAVGDRVMQASDVVVAQFVFVSLVDILVAAVNKENVVVGFGLAQHDNAGGD